MFAANISDRFPVVLFADNIHPLYMVPEISDFRFQGSNVNVRISVELQFHMLRSLPGLSILHS